MYADSHVHVDGFSEAHLASLLDAATAKGVGLVLGVGTTIEASRTTIDLSHRFPIIAPAVGIHPWGATPHDVEAFAELRQLAGEPGVVAIGELGIDVVRYPDTGELQWQLFRQQVAVAVELNLALILHCRGARDEIVEFLRGHAPVRGVMHGFDGNLDQAEAWLELGLHIGVGVRAFHGQPSLDLVQAIQGIPLDRLLLETDASTRSYASEEALQPARIPELAQQVARIKGCSSEEVGRVTTAALKALLRS